MREPTDPAAPALARAEALFADLSLATVTAWKAAHPGRPAIGHLPVYAPRELIDACGALPVGITGGGDQIDIVKGDACFQSYICHLPRSTVELGLGGQLDPLDGMVFPSTCDVIRNLSGIWQILFPSKLSFYLDLPQSFEDAGARFYRLQLEELADKLLQRGGLPLTPERLAASLRRYNENRAAIARLYQLRAEAPWQVPADECFVVVKAGNLLPPETHTSLVEEYLDGARRRQRRAEDRIRVVIVGSFCETPPLGLLRTLERAGCYVVGDDLNSNARWIQGDIDPGADPLEALVQAYLEQSTWSSVRYEHEKPRAEHLVEWVRRVRADGVIFAAPSFCDPALLDQPPLSKALEAAQIPFTLFKYAENTGQFQSIREQVGTFSDSLRLWGAA